MRFELPDARWFIPAVIVFTILFYSVVLCHAYEYTDEQIVNAIYKAEGGAKARYPYGIRSINCETERECRQVCFNTVKNQRKRFAKKHRNGQTYLSSLSERYCPIGADNDPRGLNKNWLKNVKHFLEKEVN